MNSKITIKALADELGIDKKKVSYQVSKLDDELVEKIDGKIYLSDVAILAIKKNFINRNKTNLDGKINTNFDNISHKLIQEKDAQLSLLKEESNFLKKQIVDLNTLLDQQQQLQLKTQQMLAEKASLLELKNDELNQLHEKKWWQFWK